MFSYFYTFEMGFHVLYTKLLGCLHVYCLASLSWFGVHLVPQILSSNMTNHDRVTGIFPIF